LLQALKQKAEKDSSDIFRLSVFVGEKEVLLPVTCLGREKGERRQKNRKG
jgi:hypothetical protein